MTPRQRAMPINARYLQGCLVNFAKGWFPKNYTANTALKSQTEKTFYETDGDDEQSLKYHMYYSSYRTFVVVRFHFFF